MAVRTSADPIIYSTIHKQTSTLESTQHTHAQHSGTHNSLCISLISLSLPESLSLREKFFVDDEDDGDEDEYMAMALHKVRRMAAIEGRTEINIVVKKSGRVITQSINFGLIYFVCKTNARRKAVIDEYEFSSNVQHYGRQKGGRVASRGSRGCDGINRKLVSCNCQEFDVRQRPAL